ncbi:MULTISPECIES: hypothetical protein [unclassified Streptomyces]|uniref:hypothetical protein n=1 Tax=unclassified Streptomyces TaxID=2593676 RepID=UPI0040411E8C
MTTVTIDQSIDAGCPKSAVLERLIRLDHYARFPGVEETQTHSVDRRTSQRSSRVAIKSSTRNSPRFRRNASITAFSATRRPDGTFTLRQLHAQHTGLRLHTECDRHRASERYHLDRREPAGNCRTSR